MSLFRGAPVPVEKDIEITQSPDDSISAIAFSGIADYLAVASWDNSVRIYEVSSNGQAQGKAMYSHQGPVLDVCWSKDGTRIFSGGADNAGRMFDITTGQSIQVAQHDAPIKSVKWVDAQSGILATASWDKTLKYWDLRASTPVTNIVLPERCYSMDIQYPFVAVGMAQRTVQIFDLKSPTTPYKTIQSPLKWQTRVVSCFSVAGRSGFALGSIEGRVAFQYFGENESGNNFSFKCHRRDATPNGKDQSIIYAINDISFHPVYGTFSTCGSDGTYSFWDKDSRTRLKTFDTAKAPITCSSFNRTGSIFAYGISYDWSKGYPGNIPNQPSKIMLHAVKDDEMKRRARR